MHTVDGTRYYCTCTADRVWPNGHARCLTPGISTIEIAFEYFEYYYRTSTRDLSDLMVMRTGNGSHGSIPNSGLLITLTVLVL